MDTDLHYFDWLKSKPRIQAAFNAAMSSPRKDRGEDWYNFYPVEDKLHVAGTETLLVDIGGGIGHEVVAFHARFPELQGRLVVQDITVDKVKTLPSEIVTTEHDFFTLQPIRGAKAYYLRAVLHNWPDKQAREILGPIRDAMNQHSNLLINGNVMAESDAPLFSAQRDLSMMAFFPALDRTETQF